MAVDAKGSSMSALRWRIALWAVAAGAVLWAAFVSRTALAPFGVGAVVGYALLPVVERIAAVIPLRADTVRRGIAVFIVYAVFGGMLVISVSMLAPIVAAQVTNFVQTLPAHLDAANQSLSQMLQEYRARLPEGTRIRIDGYVQNAADSAAGAASAYARRSFDVVTGTLSILLGYLVVPFWLFYMLRDRLTLQRGFLRAAPTPFREDVRYIFVMIDHVIGRYIRAQLLLGLVVGSAVGISLSVLGVPLAAGLGVWAGFTELIPIIGPWIGSVPGLLLVVGTNPQLILPVALVYFLVQQLENQFLVPRIQGQATDISAGMVILLLVVGGAAFGLTGLIVIVPACAILREMFWYIDRRLRGAPAHEAFAESRASRDGHGAQRADEAD
jgi:predicted PurR-regulated permease PerM